MREATHHAEISSRGMELAASFWGSENTSQKAAQFSAAITAPESAQAELRKQKREAKQADAVGNIRSLRSAELSVEEPASAADIQQAFDTAKQQCGGKDDAGEWRQCTTSQRKLINIVCKRALDERRGKGHPMKLLVHGRPGVGKSTVLKAILAAFDQVGMHEEVAVAAHMATMAQQIGGQTLFSLFGWKVGGWETEQQRDKRRNKVEAWLSRTRWLIIDEISCVDGADLKRVEEECCDQG
jgi:hypothetical protein